MKDDSGSYAVCTEQGSSPSQMTAAKVMDVIARPLGCAGQAAAASGQNAGRFNSVETSYVRMSRYFDVSTKTQVTKSWSNIEEPVCPLERHLYGHSLAGLLWERQFEKSFLGTRMGQRTELGMLVCATKARSILVRKRG